MLWSRKKELFRFLNSNCLKSNFLNGLDFEFIWNIIYVFGVISGICQYGLFCYVTKPSFYPNPNHHQIFDTDYILAHFLNINKKNEKKPHWFLNSTNLLVSALILPKKNVKSVMNTVVDICTELHIKKSWFCYFVSLSEKGQQRNQFHKIFNVVVPLQLNIKTIPIEVSENLKICIDLNVCFFPMFLKGLHYVICVMTI